MCSKEMNDEARLWQLCCQKFLNITADCFRALPTACVCAYLVGEGGWDPCGRAPPASEERLEGPAIGNKGFMEAELPARTARQTLISKLFSILKCLFSFSMSSLHWKSKLRNIRGR